MQFRRSIFADLLKPIDRRRFRERVAELDADRYDKSFGSWDHMLALLYGQLSRATSLRALVTGFNANARHHYHLGASCLARSTLSDANARRPPDILAQTFAEVVKMAGRQIRGEA